MNKKNTLQAPQIETAPWRKAKQQFQLIFKFYLVFFLPHALYSFTLQTGTSETRCGRVAQSAVKKAKEAYLESQSSTGKRRGRRRGHQRGWVSHFISGNKIMTPKDFSLKLKTFFTFDLFFLCDAREFANEKKVHEGTLWLWQNLSVDIWNSR